MARETSKLGLNPGRYRRVSELRLCSSGTKCDCFHCVLVLERNCPMVSGFVLVSKRAKCIESD